MYAFMSCEIWRGHVMPHNVADVAALRTACIGAIGVSCGCATGKNRGETAQDNCFTAPGQQYHGRIKGPARYVTAMLLLRQRRPAGHGRPVEASDLLLNCRHDGDLFLLHRCQAMRVCAVWVPLRGSLQDTDHRLAERLVGALRHRLHSLPKQCAHM